MRTKTPTSKDNFLALMGITVWKQRGALSPVSSGITLELLHDINTAPYLVLVGEQGIGKTLDESAKSLLKNILKAIDWPLKECAWAEWIEETLLPVDNEEIQDLEDQLQLLGIKKILVLGECPLVDFNRPTCQIPSIQEMQTLPQAKRMAWQKLQQHV